MKRIFTTLLFVAVFSTTVNAQGITFSYLEEPKTALHVPKKHISKPKKKRSIERANYATSVSVPSARHAAGPRPGKWCGWYMRTKFGGGPEYNLARNWAKRGVSAGGPAVGAVVVWKHHVGVIVGRASNGQWLVHSGNDSNRVRIRPRSVAGAIAFRML